MCVLERIRVNLRAMSNDGDENASRHFFTFSKHAIVSRASQFEWDNAYAIYCYDLCTRISSPAPAAPRPPSLGSFFLTRLDPAHRTAPQSARARTAGSGERTGRRAAARRGRFFAGGNSRHCTRRKKPSHHVIGVVCRVSVSDSV